MNGLKDGAAAFVDGIGDLIVWIMYNLIAIIVIVVIVILLIKFRPVSRLIRRRRAAKGEY